MTSISKLFSAQLSMAAGRPTIYNYKPHPKQVRFHKSTKKIRLVIGGNRSGKTESGCAEDVYLMKGESPYRKVPPPPTRGRIVAPSLNEGIGQIIIPKLKKLLPPSLLINGSWEDSYYKTERLLTLENGSTCQMMSYEQELKKFEGASLHWVHMDEEPPFDIYNANLLRTLDTHGGVYICMTPEEGITWVNEKLYIPGLSGEASGILVVIINTHDNPYLSAEDIQAVEENLDEEDRKARIEGKFVPLGGYVYPFFDEKIHVYHDEIDPSKLFDWQQYTSLDHGLNNPTCWLWHAVHPSGFMVTFDEMYVRNMTVSEIAAEYNDRNSRPGRRAPDYSVGDPSIRNRQATDKLSIQRHYAMQGISIKLGNNDVAFGVDQVTAYLKTGRRIITPNCTKLISETAKLRWKVYESAKKRHDNNPRPEIHKKNDHAPDSDRYFHAEMPLLRIPEKMEVDIEKRNNTVAQLLGARPYYARIGVYDEAVRRPPPVTEWTVVDEHMGGYY